MKKLLGLFTAIGVVATTSSSVVSCFDYKLSVERTDLALDLTPYE